MNGAEIASILLSNRCTKTLFKGCYMNNNDDINDIGTISDDNSTSSKIFKNNKNITKRRKRKSRKTISSDTAINSSYDVLTTKGMPKRQKESVFILGDSMVKHINGFLITKTIGHKYLVKTRPFKGAKAICMYDHSRPTIREFDPEYIILAIGTNDLTTEKKSSEIAKSIIDLAASLKSNRNEIVISLIVPRGDALSSKASEVNDRLRHMCVNRDFQYIDHTDSIDVAKHLNDEGLHLNRFGSAVLAKNFANFLLDLN